MFKGLPELIDVCSCVLFHLTSRLMLGIIWGYVDVFLSSFFPLRGGGEPRQRSNQVLSFGGGRSRSEVQSSTVSRGGVWTQTLVILVIRAPTLSVGCAVKAPTLSVGCAALTPTLSVGCADSKVFSLPGDQAFPHFLYPTAPKMAYSVCLVSGYFECKLASCLDLFWNPLSLGMSPCKIA